MRRLPIYLLLIAVFLYACGGPQATAQAGAHTTPPAPPRHTPAGPPIPGTCGSSPDTITTTAVTSTYTTAPTFSPTGFFTTGQKADILLSGVDFDNAGGGLFFNHPSGLATDGTRLLLVDRNNNRILVWNTLPTTNTAPNLVLGQTDFTHNNPGIGLGQMNWPSAVSIGQNKVAIADTENDRILVWLTFPTQSGQPADFALDLTVLGPALGRNFEWPWGVWTDGTKLAVVSTFGTAAVLIWNTFPTSGSTLPNVVLTNPAFGTPRYLSSDGTRLSLWDHNLQSGSGIANNGAFVWNAWPTSNNATFSYSSTVHFAVAGAVAPDGKFVAAGSQGLMVWNTFPAAEIAPSLVVSGAYVRMGDGIGAVVAGGKVYAVDGNANKIVGYNAMPTQANQLPDFVIGSPNLCTNTLIENFILSNPIPASDGQHLFVVSDFDRKLYVWRTLPNQSNAYPDQLYTLPYQPQDIALYGNVLALAGQSNVTLWTQLPLTGNLPTASFTNTIGNVTFSGLKGVALDAQHFYLADDAAGKIYVWNGLPTANSNPAYTLTVGQALSRIESDGRYLTVISNLNGTVIKLYAVNDLNAPPLTVQAAGTWRFNLPSMALTIGDHLLVSDTGFGRVLGWRTITAAVTGAQPDLILGATTLTDTTQEIGQDKLFWPTGLAFDGRYLWVGEFKFSERLLRYSLPRALYLPMVKQGVGVR